MKKLESCKIHLKMPLSEPLYNKFVGLHLYLKENFEYEFFLAAFLQNTSGQLLLKVGSTTYLRLSEQTLFQTLTYDWKDYMSKMFSTNTCFLLTTDLNFRGVLKVSFSSEDVNKSVKYNLSFV